MTTTKALIKPELLAWTRNRARVTIEDAARVAGVEPDSIKAWEGGSGAPSVSQLRHLAAKYQFPLAVFYLPNPPADFAPLRDFRRLPTAEDRDITPNLAFHIRSAYERRELALELRGELGEDAQPLRLRATAADDPEQLGTAIRGYLGISEDAQVRAAKQGRSFDFWRRRFEEKDILVFVISGPHHGVDLEEMRGFAIAKDELPVIVVNGRDYSEGGKCYTLLHEFTHILLGESAITNGQLGTTTEEQRIERFCDTVAAAALMPRNLLLSFPQVRPIGERKWSDEDLRNMARTVGVSREAFLLRLVSLRRATWDFYNFRRAKFRQEYEEAAVQKAMADKKPIPIKRSILLMSWNGRGFTRLVLRSYYDQRITLNDVSSYLGAKVKHIPALEKAAFQAAE